MGKGVGAGSPGPRLSPQTPMDRTEPSREPFDIVNLTGLAFGRIILSAWSTTEPRGGK